MTLASFSCAERLAEGAVPAKSAAELNADRELHVVGLYEGFTKSGGKVHGGKARVIVKRPGKQVILVLSAYDSITWEVSATQDTRLERVILCGYHRQAVHGLPSEVGVTKAFREGRTGEDVSLACYAYRLDSPAFRTLVEALHDKVGLHVSSFSGAYRAPANEPVTVEQVQNDPRLSADWPVPSRKADLPKLTFNAMYVLAGKYGHETKVSYGEFALAGPNEKSLKPAPQGVWRMTHDPDGKKYYGVAEAGNAIVEIDMDKRALRKLDLGLDVPRLNTPTDLTVDTKRKRVLLCASGCLYAYSPARDKWSILTDGFRVMTMAYHPGEDMLYSVRADHEGRITFAKFNPEGAALQEIPLDGPIDPRSIPQGPAITGLQLIHTNGRLVLLVGPGGHHLSPVGADKPLKRYIYIVDPRSGKAELTWKGM